MNEIIVRDGNILFAAAEARKELQSCELSRNAKGEYSYCVKCYAETIEDAVVRVIAGKEWVEKALADHPQDGGKK